MPDERERDQLWKRIDDHGKRLNDCEQGLVEVKSRAENNSEMIQTATKSAQRMQESVDALHTDMSQLIGAAKTIKWIGIGLGAILAFIEIGNALGAALPGLPL